MIERFERSLAGIAPYMAGAVARSRALFGPDWEEDFEKTLAPLFADDPDALEKAIKGYVRFALDATRLQKKFERDRVYAPKSYEEASSEVYHNEEYMNSLYIPGILLSHYLWKHHYNQLIYFRNTFAPLVKKSKTQEFCDIGIGSGFYSRQMLALGPEVRGKAFDISEPAVRYATHHLQRFGLLDRWEYELRDVVAVPPEAQWPFLVSVEVLEHLEDPTTFLRALRRMLRPGGHGFITAAITAPNADHIYLYNDSREVRDQLVEAGFQVLQFQEDIAYKPKKDEPVPRLAAFIVT